MRYEGLSRRGWELVFRFLVDIPPSVKSAYRVALVKGNPRIVMNLVSKQYVGVVYWLCRESFLRKRVPIDKRNKYGIIEIMYDRENRRDLDNHYKMVQDCTCRAVGLNDVSIYYIYQHKVVDKRVVKPCLVVEFGTANEFISRTKWWMRQEHENKLAVIYGLLDELPLITKQIMDMVESDEIIKR